MSSDEGFVPDFLSRFSYEDWETGNDGKLRVGDYLIRIHFEPSTGAEVSMPAKIELFDNGIPVFLLNEDPYDEGDSGEFYSIMEAHLAGYAFYRIDREIWLNEALEGLDRGSLPMSS